LRPNNKFVGDCPNKFLPDRKEKKKKRKYMLNGLGAPSLLPRGGVESRGDEELFLLVDGGDVAVDVLDNEILCIYIGEGWEV
jgi:hypothetical protein